MRRRGLLLALLALAAVLAFAKLAAAAVTVTPASGGTNISADDAGNAAAPAWTTLGNIVVAEGANGDFQSNQSNVTLILTAPSNWEFNPGVGTTSVTPTNSAITVNSTTVAASTITVNLSVDNKSRSDALTISGVQVRPINGGAVLPSSGNILRTAGNPGTAVIAGIVNGTTNFGSLSMAAGAPRLAITAVNGGSNPAAGAAFSVTVAKRDQFGHAITAVAATGVSLSLDTGTGTLGGTLTGTIAAGSSSATINGVTYTKAESGVILTATRTSGDTPLPSGNSAAFTVDPGAVADFLVEAAGGGAIGTQTAGTSFDIRVTARDANGNTVTGFTGAGNTVDVTSTGTLSAGGGTTAAFTSGVLASHSVTVSNTGSFTVTVTRTSGGSQSGTSASFTVNPGALSTFLVEAAGGGSIGTQTAGTSFDVRVTARDALGNTVTGFNGAGNTIDVTSTGTLSSGGGTTATFSNGVLESHAVTISNSGIFAITATRTSGGSQTGTSNSFSVDAGAVSLFVVEAAGGGAIGPQTAGSGFNVRVTARDALGNIATGFTGTVDISSTGTLSAGSGTTAAFTAGVLASHAVTISNTGSFTITATRTSGGSQSGTSASFTVGPGALDNFLVEAAGGGPVGTQTAGTSFNVRVVARDAGNNTVSGFTGTVDVTSTGTLSAGAGTTAAFTNGVLASHGVTVSNTGSFTITATRTSGGSQSGTSNAFTVDPGALDHFIVEAAGGGAIGTQIAGASFDVQVTARDAANNTVTGFAGTVDVSSTGTLSAGGGTTAAFSSGVLASHAVTVSNTGSFTITATRTSGGSQSGTSNAFTVDPGALDHFVVEAAGGGPIGTQAAGTGFDVRITAEDADDNTVTGFTGTVDVTSTGTLSAGGGTTAAFTNGVLASHSVTISNSGSFTVTATDTSGPEAGTSNAFTVDPGAAAKLVITAVPANAALGSTFSVTVRSQDAAGNFANVSGATGYSLSSSGAGSLGGNSGTIAAGSSTSTLNGVTYDTAETITLTAARTSGDALASSDPSSSVVVKPRPTSSVDFPGAGASNAAAWSAGCGTAGFCGTATDNSGLGLAGVELSIRRGSGNYWDGDGFDNASEQFVGASLAGSSWSYAFPAASFPADGDYTVRVRATDNLGGAQSPPTLRTFTFDATAPAGAVTFPAAGGTYGAATWNDPAGTASDASSGVAEVELSIRRVSTNLYWNGSAFADGSETWHTASGTASWSLAFATSDFPADGDYVVRVRAVDNAGNTESATSYSLTYDTAAPNTTVDSQPDDPTSSNDPSFSFSSSESGSTFECRIDGGSWSACTSPQDYTDLADAAHTFDVRATDTTDNTDPTPATVAWTIDTAAPNTTITAQPADPASSNDSSFSFSSSESGSTFECRIDAGSWSACTSPHDYTDLGDGDHTFDVRAIDAADNTDPTPDTFTWTIDTGAPSSVAAFPVNLASYNTAGWNGGCSPSGVCGTASDGGVGLDRVEVSIQRGADGLYWDGSGFASATEDWLAATGTVAWKLPLAAASFPSEGSYTIRVRAHDSAGNVEAAASRTFTVDTSAPETTIDSGASDPTNDQSPSFAFSADEPGSTFECRLDGGSWAACTSPHGETGLAAGAHTFDVRATDAAGNLDPSPASTAWTIDLAAPSSTIAFPSASGSYNAAGWGDPSGSASDAVGLDSVELSLRQISSGLYWNGTDFSDGSENWRTATGTGSWSLAFAAADFPTDGDYALRVRARDAAGNVEVPSSRTFTVDTVAPETTIDAGPSGPTDDADASFAFSADQPGSTFECRPDGGSWAACTSPRAFTGLAQGAHTFEVRATDAGANTDATPAERTWTVDTVPPSATMTAPASGAYVGATVSLTASTSDAGGTGVATVAFEKSPAGAGTWTPVPASWVTAPGDDGLYDVRVVATDNAGNVTTSSPSTNVRVDNTPPTAIVDSLGPGVTGTVALTHSSSDAGSGIEPTSVQFEYRQLPAGAWTPTAASWDTSALPEGQYEVRVGVADRAGNAATSAPEATIVDNTAPTVDFTVPTDLGFVNAASTDPLTLAAEAADAGSGVDDVEFFTCDDPGCSSETSLGSDDTGPYEATWPLPGSDGTVTLKAVARDAAGNEAETVIAVTVDRTLPDTSLLGNPGNPSNDASPDFTFSSTETGTFECRVDAGLWSACASPHTAGSLADGTHTFEVRAIDAAGNVDASPSSWTWLLDATAPIATMDDPGANLRQLVTLTSTQSDPGGAAASGIASVQYEYSVAGAETWVATPSAWNTPTVLDGLYDVRVVVTDVAGNVTQSAAVPNRRVDNSPPATGMDDPGANLRATVTLTGSASDAGSGVQDVVFELSPDGGSWSTVGMDAAEPFEASFDTATMPDGLYFFRTVATDVAGNVATSAAVGPRRIDNTLPTATMNDPGGNLRGTVNLSSVTDDPPGPPVASGVSSVVYEALIGGTWTGISQTWATTSVPDGVYDLRVVVTDVAGNQTISNVVGGRRIDNTAPSTGHNAPGNWQSGGVTVSLSPSDGGSGIANTQYSVDGGGWNGGTTVNVSGDGIHTISFFSTDVAGNVESPQTATVMIDSTPPDPGASDPGNYLRGSVDLTANPDAGGGGAEVTEVEFQHKRSSDSTWTTIAVDTTDGDNPPYTATWATTPADDGSWDLRFIVRDEADNESIADLGSKIVDNTAPTGSLASPLGGSTVSGSVSLGVSASDANPIASVEYFVGGGSVGSSASAPYQGSWNSASGGDGSASIHAVISDMAGNTTTTGGVSVTVDNFAPTITLSGSAPNVSGTIGLSASASGDTSQVTFERRPAGGGGWTTIGTSLGGPWSATFDTTAVADGNYELRAIAVDAGANSGTSNVVTTRVDNTAPTGLLTQPGDGAIVGGSVALGATASDPGSGSGIGSVSWQARTGGGGFADVGSAASAPYTASWSVDGLASGAYDLQLVVTDNAGNTFTSAFITVDVDATAPGVTLDDPGSTLSGTVALTASTSGDATSVAFARSPAGAASWTAIGSDGTAPYGASLDTTALADGLYDLRAVVTDAVGNTNESVRAGVRVDNLVPIVVSSVPANGSIVASASQIAITATEDIASLSAVELDGVPAPAPTISGKTATFNTGSLAAGSHTLTGTVHDAAGKSSSFTITFLVGVPTPPPPPSGGGSFSEVLPVVPAPSDFRGTIEADGTLTLRWTPATDADGEPYPTVLFVDDFATQTFRAGDDQVDLGAFDPADMRTFALASTDDGGHLSPTTSRLRSTSLLAGKSLDEAAAILANRGFELGAVTGEGTVVVEPAAVRLAGLGSKLDLRLGEPGTPPQTRLVFNVVGTKNYSPASRRFIALRLQSTRDARVTTALLGPRGERVYRWRFAAKAGTAIRRLTMPPRARKAGRYRLVFTVQSGRDSVKKTILVEVLPERAPKKPKPDRRPVEVVLTGGSSMQRDIAAGVGRTVRVTAALDEDTWTLIGSNARNVQVVLVDVDRFGLQLVRDLRLVFPSVRVIALTNDPRRLAQSVRAGATIAVPRSTPPKDLARLIVQLAKRRG